MHRIPPINQQDFLLLRDFIHKRYGIYFPENKKYFLENHLSRRMRELGIESYRQYYDFLKHSKDKEGELKRLVDEITITESSFFRNMPQFQALEGMILPELVRKKGKADPRRLRIWSAGCSSGEEPYTIAMILLERKQDLLKDYIFEIIATDISEAALSQAKKGRYKPYRLRNTPLYYKVKYFQQQGEDYSIAEEVRGAVKFELLNLKDDLRMMVMRGFDIIFCRNVLIYFDLELRRRVVRHFYQSLSSPGYLFLGHSETLYGINERFKPLHFSGGIVYKK